MNYKNALMRLNILIVLAFFGVNAVTLAAWSAESHAPTINLPVNDALFLELVLIPAGQFMMGTPLPISPTSFDLDESPPHLVKITKSFYMSKYEITHRIYQAVMGENPSNFQYGIQFGINVPLRPVEQVSWKKATEFCKILAKKTGKSVRLPTEAEWEYACRAGSTTKYYHGDDTVAIAVDRIAWFSVDKYVDTFNSGGMTHPVGQKEPNSFGLYDMLGNVEEWCSDYYGPYTANEQIDPQGPAIGTNQRLKVGPYRVLRGGSWLSYPEYCYCARRSDLHEAGFYKTTGFRIVVECQTCPPKTELIDKIESPPIEEEVPDKIKKL